MAQDWGYAKPGLTDPGAGLAGDPQSSSALEFTTSPVTTGDAGDPYSYSVGAQGGVAPLVLTLQVGPGWLDMTDHGGGSGTLGGTPDLTSHGDHSITVRVTDDGGAFLDQSFTLSISAEMAVDASISPVITFDAVVGNPATMSVVSVVAVSLETETAIQSSGGTFVIQWVVPDETTQPTENVDPVYQPTYAELA